MVQFQNLPLFLAICLLHFSLSTSFPQGTIGKDQENIQNQSGISNPIKIGDKNKDQDINSLGKKTLVKERQDEEEDDDGDEGPSDAETRVKVVNGVGNILTGALTLNPVKVLKGAFGFADTEIQDNILNVILGIPPPSQQKTAKPNPTKAAVTEGIVDELEIGEVVTEAITTIKIQPRTQATTTTLKPKKTTKPQQLPGQEDDEDYVN